jgi:glycerophosphoryl diester phosphodiesterase
VNRVELVVQGHRGSRGHYPENSIIACKHALDLGVDALELDVVVSSDGELIVSHEPYMDHSMCLKPDGSEISQAEEGQFNLYKMKASEIKKYSFGTLPYDKFPNQKKVKCHKLPLVEFVNDLHKEIGDSFPTLTIEIKSTANGDGVFHPEPKKYADLIVKTIDRLDEQWPVIIQSFDLRILKELDKKNVEFPLVVLNDNKEMDIDAICEYLQFIPEGYSPHYEMIDETIVNDCAELGIMLSTWTVNDKAEAERLFGLGVRNFISDYPEIFD